MPTTTEILEGIGDERPTAPCTVQDWRKLDEPGDVTWLGPPLPQELVEELYPSRVLFQWDGLSAQERQAAIEAYERQQEEAEEDKAAAVAHFRGVEFDDGTDGTPGFTVHVGDYVKIDLDDRNTGVGQIIELFQDPTGRRRFRLHWFYSIFDEEVQLLVTTNKGTKNQSTSLGALAGFDPNHLWRAKEKDADAYHTEFDLAVVDKRVEVTQVLPGQEPPKDGSYWWDLECGQICFTFENPEEMEPSSKEEYEDTPRLIRVMDLYAGAGGLGYLDTRTCRCEIRTDWAVDYMRDMRNSFKCNFQHAHAFQSGTDEWLCLCKVFKRLCDRLGVGEQDCNPDNFEAFAHEKLELCRDDEMVAPPRSLVLEARAPKPRGRKRPPPVQQQQQQQQDNAGPDNSDGEDVAIDDAIADLADDSETGSEEEGEEEEEEEEAGPSNKRSRTAAGKKAAGGGGGGGKKAGKDSETPMSPQRKKQHSAAELEARGIAWPSVPHKPKPAELADILAVRLCEKGPRVPKKAGVGCNQLMRTPTESECRLEFKVRWASGAAPEWASSADGCGGEEEGESWLPEGALSHCTAKLTDFCRKLRWNQTIPFPGEVHLMCGGPPCQGVSGNNRHAQMKDILTDPRNRQLLVFLETVEWFKPNYVLMENVQDIMKKEDGKYAKYALGTMLQSQYQIRMGLLAAGDFGVPQGRWRCFMWGALRQEQLPAYPEATHNCRNFQCAVCKMGKLCQGGFLNFENMRTAKPAVLLGDTLSDLPPMTNFELREQLRYEQEPQTAHQVFLRRPPRPWQTSIAERLKFRQEMMAGKQRALNTNLLEEGKAKGMLALGAKSLNNKNPLVGSKTQKRANGKDKGSHAYETLDAVLGVMAEKDSRLADVMRLQFEASRRSYQYERGVELDKLLRTQLDTEEEQMNDPEAILTDHRPLCLNDDDYLRCKLVPERTSFEEEVNFRSLEGMVTNKDGTGCYGHTHAARVNGETGCCGGGTFDAASKEAKHGLHRGGNAHQLRVDQRDKDGWRGVSLGGCDAYCKFLPTMDPEVPRWCLTFKKGKSKGRHGGYGRVHYAGVVATVIGRSEPHNMELVHTKQDRVMTIRENARTQGFPDYHMFVAETGTNRWVRNNSLKQRYQMIGNAVCPAVASALGRCLALAAVGESPVGQEFITVPDQEYEEAIKAARAQGLGYYIEEYGFERMKFEARYCAQSAARPAPGEEEDEEDESDDDSEEESDESDDDE